MGCGASSEGGSSAAEPAAPAEPVIPPVDPAKFASVLKGKGSIGDWLGNTKLLLVRSTADAAGPGEEVEWTLEILDVTTQTSENVGTLMGSGWPTITASPDLKHYVMSCGLEIKLANAETHEIIVSMTAPGDAWTYVDSMRFSPNGKLIAAVAGNVCTVYDLTGKSLHTFTGEKKKMYARWYDDETLLCPNEWLLLIYSVVSGEQLCKWEIPKGNVNELWVMKSKKLMISDDNGKVQKVSWNPATKACTIDSDHSAPYGSYSGPCNFIAFSENLVFYEKGGGGHFYYHNLETGDKSELKRGDCAEDDLPSVSYVKLSPDGTFLATSGFGGLEVFRMKE